MDGNPINPSSEPSGPRKLLERVKKVAEPRFSVTDHIIQLAGPLAFGWISKLQNVPFTIWVPAGLFVYIGVTDLIAKRRAAEQGTPVSRGRMPTWLIGVLAAASIGLMVYYSQFGSVPMNSKKLIAQIAIIALMAVGLICVAVYQYLMSLEAIEPTAAKPTQAWSEEDLEAIALIEQAKRDGSPERKIQELSEKLSEKEGEVAQEKGRADAAEQKAKGFEEHITRFTEQQPRWMQVRKDAEASLAAKINDRLSRDEQWPIPVHLAAIEVLEQHKTEPVRDEEQWAAWQLYLEQKKEVIAVALNACGIGNAFADPMPPGRLLKDYSAFNEKHRELQNEIDYYVEVLNSKPPRPAPSKSQVALDSITRERNDLQRQVNESQDQLKRDAFREDIRQEILSIVGGNNTPPDPKIVETWIAAFIQVLEKQTRGLIETPEGVIRLKYAVDEITLVINAELKELFPGKRYRIGAKLPTTEGRTFDYGFSEEHKIELARVAQLTDELKEIALDLNGAKENASE